MPERKVKCGRNDVVDEEGGNFMVPFSHLIEFRMGDCWISKVTQSAKT